MSIALVAPPSAPAVEVLARLEDLRSTLAQPALELDDARRTRDQAETIRAFAHASRLGLDVANQAIEVRLRAERRCGLILIELLERAGPPSTRPSRRKNIARQPDHARLSLPRRTLADLDISPKDSSRWQLIARLPELEFEQRIRARHESGRALSAEAILRAASQFKRMPGGRSTTPTASLLRRVLLLLRDVTRLRGTVEVELAHQVIATTERWVLPLAAENRTPPTSWQRAITCLLCGREAPPKDPPARCGVCGGAWLAASID